MKNFFNHKIKQCGLFIATLFFAFCVTAPAAFAAGYTWTDQSAAGNRYWDGIASSSDGKYVAASTGTGTVWVSSDYGSTWTNRTPPVSGRFWYGITSSADGSHLAVVDASPGHIWTSTNYGVTWTDQTNSGTRSWLRIASSSDGSRLIAATNNGVVDISADGGSTWNVASVSGTNFTSVSSSASGQYLAATDFGAGVSGGFIYTSSDYGANWTQQVSGGQKTWGAVNISPDGSHIFAGDGTHLYYSTNHGSSWSQAAGTTGTPDWQTISSSTSGQYLIAAGNNATPVWISSDFGVNWTADTTPTTLLGWNATAISADGSRLFLGGNNDGGNTHIWSAYDAALDSSLIPATPSASTPAADPATTTQAPDTGYGAPHPSYMVFMLSSTASLVSIGGGTALYYRSKQHIRLTL